MVFLEWSISSPNLLYRWTSIKQPALKKEKASVSSLNWKVWFHLTDPTFVIWNLGVRKILGLKEEQNCKIDPKFCSIDTMIKVWLK